MTVRIVEVVEAVKAGTPLAEAIPEGADLKLWQRLVDNYTPAKSCKGKSTRRTRRSYTNKRTNYAAQVIARNKATVELVKRVNGSAPADDFITIHSAGGTTRVSRAGKMRFDEVTK